jgi:hypothetical protein
MRWRRKSQPSIKKRLKRERSSQEGQKEDETKKKMRLA